MFVHFILKACSVFRLSQKLATFHLWAKSKLCTVLENRIHFPFTNLFSSLLTVSKMLRIGLILNLSQSFGDKVN